MIEESQLRDIEARLQEVADIAVSITNDPDDAVRLKMTVGSASGELRVMRDLQPAAKGDVIFIGHAFSDVRRLMGIVRTGAPPDAGVLDVIKGRVAATSPAPWFAFIESDGGQAGCDVIRVSDEDDEPDMYLWLDDVLVPSRVFRFVAGARQDIPALLEAIESGVTE